MSVETKSDEFIEEAKQHLKHAHKKLLEALDPDTWGHDQYKYEYIDFLEDTMAYLRKVLRRMS